MEENDELLKEFKIYHKDLLTEIREALKGYFNAVSTVNGRKLYIKFCNSQRFIVSIEER